MNQRIDQSLLQRFVKRRTGDAIAFAIKLKRPLDAGAGRQLEHHLLVKLENVAFPGAIQRQPIRPAFDRIVGKTLAVVEMKAGQRRVFWSLA
jgi:hypothetical protein